MAKPAKFGTRAVWAGEKEYLLQGAYPGSRRSQRFIRLLWTIPLPLRLIRHHWNWVPT